MMKKKAAFLNTITYNNRNILNSGEKKTSKLESFSSTQSNLSNLLPKNRITISSSSINNSKPTCHKTQEKRLSQTKSGKRNLERKSSDESSDESNDESSDESSDESENSSSDSDNVKRRKYNEPIQSESKESKESNSKKSSSENFSSCDEYFKVCEVNGETMYIILPDKVQTMMDFVKKDKAFADCIRTVITIQNELVKLVERYPTMFSRNSYHTTVEKKEYCIPKHIVEKAFPKPNPCQTKALNILAKDMFHHDQIEELTKEERNVCRNFFREVLKADGENVRKIINASKKKQQQA